MRIIRIGDVTHSEMHSVPGVTEYTRRPSKMCSKALDQHRDTGLPKQLLISLHACVVVMHVPGLFRYESTSRWVDEGMRRRSDDVVVIVTAYHSADRLSIQAVGMYCSWAWEGRRRRRRVGAARQS